MMLPTLNPRFIPAILFVALILTRWFIPDFLSTPIYGWITWYGVLFVVLLYVSAYALTPLAVRVFNRLASTWFLPPAIFIVFLGGAVWLIQSLFNVTFAHWFGWPEWRILEAIGSVIFGA